MSDEGFILDHVIYGCVDIDATARRLRDDHGLGTVPAGVHLGGTTNLIVPLRPPQYLELLGIGDPSKDDAAWLQATLQGRDRVLWWVLAVNDLADSAARRGLPVQAGRMAMADGSDLDFHNAGMHRYPLPFFVAYDEDPAERAARQAEQYEAAAHDRSPTAFTFVEVGDHEPVLEGWLGPDHGLSVRYAPGTGPGAHAVGIQTADGEIVIR